MPSRLLASRTARQSAREGNVDLPLVRRSSSCMSVAEETSGKTIVGTEESFTEARALRSRGEKRSRIG